MGSLGQKKDEEHIHARAQQAPMPQPPTARAVTRCGNSGASWEPSSKKEFGLQENVEQNSRTFCQKSIFCCESHTLLAPHLFVLCPVIIECVNHTQNIP
jgi:hypothetical protein